MAELTARGAATRHRIVTGAAGLMREPRRGERQPRRHPRGHVHQQEPAVRPLTSRTAAPIYWLAVARHEADQVIEDQDAGASAT